MEVLFRSKAAIIHYSFLSSLTAYFIKRFTAGEACFTEGSIMHSVIFYGGETGTFAT